MKANWEMEEKRDKMLDKLIKKYGHESEPTIYFATLAWKNIWNMDVYFNTANNWIFS